MLMSSVEKEWNCEQFAARESNFLHAPYGPELAFYEAVRAGDVERVSKACESDFAAQKGFGKLSDNPLRNAVYHFIITTALVARFCIDGGMKLEEAYGLSDFYIRKADQCTTTGQITQLHNIMSLDYAKRMDALKKKRIDSKPVTRCMDYIYGNLHKKITLTELADYVSLNPNYLSRLFQRVTGVPVSRYIQNQKIEAARNMLRFTDYSTAQIASIFAFSSQSYFIEIFEKQVGMTPGKYREYSYKKIDDEKRQ